MKVDAEALINWINANKVEDGVTPPSVVYPCPKCSSVFTTQAELEYHMVSAHPVTPPPQPPPVPPVGAAGSKTNPYRLIYPYAPVTNGFTWRAPMSDPLKNAEFAHVPEHRVYFEVDPVALKPGVTSFQIILKGFNCPSFYIYKAYYDKTTRTYTEDVYFTSNGCIERVPDRGEHPFVNTKFLYALEVGEAWGLKLWVQLL